MTKKTLGIIIAVFLLLGSAIGYFVFGKNGESTIESNSTSSGESFFPASSDTTASDRTEGRSIGQVPSTGGGEGGSTQEESPFILRQLVSEPVNEAFLSERDGHTVVRYVARETGHMSEIAANEKVPTKVTATTLPRSFQSVWGPEGKSLLLRLAGDTFNTIDTLYAQISYATSTATTTTPASFSPSYAATIGSLEGVRLPRSIIDIAASPDRTKVFFLIAADAGVVGVTSPFKESASAKSQVPVFQSLFNEWLAAWPAPNTIALTTKASSGVPGYFYTVDLKTKKATKVLHAIPGLTATMSPDGKHIVYASSERNGFVAYLYTIASRRTDAFPLQTLPEKCVFSTQGSLVYCAVPESIQPATYPDQWYQGLIQFNDNIWSIDISTGETKLLARPSSIRKGTEIDGINLMLSPDEQSLVFKNKRDQSLWLLPLK